MHEWDAGVTPSPQGKCISTEYYWTGKGRDALEVAYGTAVTKPNPNGIRGLGD
jgi:hypothetical protein